MKASFNLRKVTMIRAASGSRIEETAKRAIEILMRFGMDAAVAGGFAVQEHGYARMTADVDIIVRDVHSARSFLSIRGFRPNQGSSMTLTDRITKVEVDLLPAGGSVGPGPLKLPKLNSADFEDKRGLPVVTLRRLIEMKLSSFIGVGIRRLKDAADVVELIKANDLPRDFKIKRAVQSEYLRLWDGLIE